MQRGRVKWLILEEMFEKTALDELVVVIEQESFEK